MSRLNDDAKSSVNTTLLSNAPLPNATNQDFVCLLSNRGPQSKPRLVCLLWGEAEVRVAFNDRAERYHSRNLVTERDATGELALLGGECA